jgi:hypothetical protein
MWQAKQAESVAWANRPPQVLATFTTAQGEVFTVNNPEQAQHIPIKDEPNAVVQGIHEIVPVLTTGIIAKSVVEVAGAIKGEYTTGDGGTITTSEVRSSYNTAEVTTDTVEGDGVIAAEMHTNSDYSADTSSVDDNSAVATPTIVTQPEPTIVPTTVVTQPEPTIVPTTVTTYNGVSEIPTE